MYKIYYGCDITGIDITDKFKELFIKSDKILIPKGTTFNKIFGDPCPTIVKNISVNSNNRCIKSINEKETINDIIFDLTNMIHIYIYCNRNTYHYFNDYITTINKIIKATIIYDIDEDIMNKNNIIIFMQTIPLTVSNKSNINNNLFVLNTEQLSNNSHLNNIKRISNNLNIIDYSRENIDIMNKNNIKNTIYFPYIYNKTEIYDFAKTEDICGIGILNTDKRKLLYNSLLENNKITNISGWEKQRDIILFKHKILLNISAFDHYNIFETIRCNRCLFNKMIIISDEKYNTDLIDYSHHILFTKLEDMSELITKVISNYDYYYKKLDLDNINYELNNDLINPQILINYHKPPVTPPGSLPV